jgi:hypothetical protein
MTYNVPRTAQEPRIGPKGSGGRGGGGFDSEEG